ncbi:MAG: TadE/TadG family type IV pilus assembly protein [Bacillota bacterium]
MKVFKNESGAVSIIVAFSMVVFIAFFGLTVDYGFSVFEKVNLQNSLDAAALAGSLELPDKNRSEIIVYEYLSKNNVDTSNLTVNITNEFVKLEKQKTINHLIMPIVGISSSDIKVISKASIKTIDKVHSGTRPFGVIDQNFNYGDKIDLKVNAEESKVGNFGAVQLGNSSGANIFRQHMLNGYDEELEVGDKIYTEPGNMSMIINPLRQMLNGSYETFDNFSRDSQRVWVIPVLSDFDVNGRSQVEVIGFASFFIEDVGKQSGQTSISGRFVEYVTSGTSKETNESYGLYTTKLTQ